jgi:acyl-CoA thioesterase
MHASNPIPRESDLSAKALEFHIESYVGVGWLECSNFAARILRAYDAAHFVRRYGPSEVRCVRDHQPIHRPAISVAAFAKTFEELLVSKVACMPSHNLAQACADYLWEQDAALRSLGLERLSIKAGQATVAMTVLPAMVNGIGITHGGAIFTLADSAFSLASNAYNERTVCAHCSISYLRPTKLGDRLVATATEVVRSGRSGIYDVSVTLEDTAIAEFRAHSRVIGGALLPTAAVT